MITIPAGVVPVQNLTTRQILYGARVTTVRYELLQHDPSTGLDSLVGFLDGVGADASLSWATSAAVKKRGTLTVIDLPVAAAGLTRIAAVNIVTTRIRPVLVIAGLPEIPLGVYVVTAAPERWSGTGRAFAVEIHDKSTVLDQDAVEVTYTVAAGAGVLAAVKTVIQSAGEAIAVDATEARTLAAPMVWPAGTFKLAIVNDLLKAIQYNALWVDGSGAFRTSAYTRPVDRSIRYSVLNDADGSRLMRELADGDQSIYLPTWDRDRDTYKVPNKVVTVAQGNGTASPLSGSATNTLASSPFSYAARGRWIVAPPVVVEVPDYSADPDPTASTTAFLNAKAREILIAMSSVQAAVSVKCLPIPLELLDAIRFASTPAGIDTRHTVQGVTIPLRFDGMMALVLQEVIDL